MSHIPQNSYRLSVKALIMDDQKRFLLALESKGYWEFLGCGLEYGEVPYACLVRELHEETGLQVLSISDVPSYLITSQHVDGSWKANVFYETKVKNLQFKASDECIELRFFTKQEALREKIYPHVKSFIQSYRD